LRLLQLLLLLPPLLLPACLLLLVPCLLLPPLCLLLLLLLLLRGMSGMAYSAPWCHQKASRVVLRSLQEPAGSVTHMLLTR
jgi:hypothetical protein